MRYASAHAHGACAHLHPAPTYPVESLVMCHGLCLTLVCIAVTRGVRASESILCLWLQTTYARQLSFALQFFVARTSTASAVKPVANLFTASDSGAAAAYTFPTPYFMRFMSLGNLCVHVFLSCHHPRLCSILVWAFLMLRCRVPGPCCCGYCFKSASGTCDMTSWLLL